MKALLITDLDNTLYNWVDYFAPSFRGMVHALSKEMKIPEGRLIDEFRGVFSDAGSVEYAFSVQNLPSCAGLSEEEVRRLIVIAKGAFKRVRDRRLQPYVGVADILFRLRREGVVVVAVTNAPRHQATRRLAQLKLHHAFDALVVWKGFHASSDDPLTKHIAEKERAGRYNVGGLLTWAVETEFLKPHVAPYLLALDYFGSTPQQTYVLGDSVAKDLVPGRKIGATTIWARYGAKSSPDNFDTLLRITNWDQRRITSTYDAGLFEPDYQIDAFAEIGLIIPFTEPVTQPDLFDDSPR